MRVFYLFLLLYGFLRSLASNISILKSVRILKRKYESSQIAKNKKLSFCRRYFILIPLLREQEVLADLVQNFTNLQGEYTLLFITTRKEEIEHRNNRTFFKKKIIPKLVKLKTLESFLEVSLGFFYRSYAKKVYKELCKKSKNQKKEFLLRMYDKKPLTGDLLGRYLKNSSRNVKVLEYSKEKGVMAHQLNYACEWIYKNYPDDENMICIYNADSLVQKNYLRILDTIKGDAIQQSSLFLRNFQEKSKSFKTAFLKGNGMLQSRWTLAHEIPRIYSQRESNPFNFLELSHVVGHGLAINLNTLMKVGGFPTKFSNEDMPLGYMLRVNNEFVEIFPSLENSDTPSTLNSVFTQYRTWFYGVAYYPKYFIYAIKSFSLSFRYKIYAFLWMMIGMVRSFKWLLVSIYWLFILLYPLFILDINLFILAMFNFIFYSLFSWLLTYWSIKRNPKIFPGNSKLEMSALDWLAVYSVYLTHSWGLIRGFIDVFKESVMGINIKKRKTER